jgi:hypothetical protein
VVEEASTEGADAPAPGVWHVIHSEALLKMLRRVAQGENPDLVYLEEYANAERE